MKLTLATLTAFCVAATFADVIVMKSGSRFTGTVKHISGGTIEFASEDVGTIKISQANVVTMTTDAAKPIEFADSREAEGIVACSNGVYSIDGNPVDMKDVKAVVPVKETWHGSVNLSASAARGNTVSETVTLMADASRRWEHDRFTAAAAYYFAQSGSSRESKQKTDDRFEIQAQEDHFWTKMIYSYVNGKYEYDRIMALDYRLRIGAGLGLQWLEGTAVDGFGKWSFNQELGASWVKERYESSFTDDYAAFRYAHHLTWDPGWLDGFAFTHNFEYLPDTADWADNYIIDCDFGFTYAFKANWQLIGKAEWDYKSKVGEGTKHSDLRYTLGLGYKW